MRNKISYYDVWLKLLEFELKKTFYRPTETTAFCKCTFPRKMSFFGHHTFSAIFVYNIIVEVHIKYIFVSPE